MSACSNTIRALSRSRVPPNKTLLPFLYQTATIQQWKAVAQPMARRSISRYSPKDEPPAADIPFEHEESLPPAIDDAEGAPKTTITGSERAAFEKLYRKFNTRGSRQQEKDHEVEIDAIADEYWEPDEDEDRVANLDKIFDEALNRGATKTRERNRSGTEQLQSRKPKDDLQNMAEHLLRGTRPLEMQARAMRAKRKGEASAQAAQIKKLRMSERSRIDDLLTSSKTDRELWETLHREVFAQVRQLDLDGTVPKPKKDSRARNTKPGPDPRIFFSNYPHHLLTALTTLRTHFSASQLALSILPTVKNYGRSSYALGATTALYDKLLRTAWLQQSSYSMLVSLLTDMHNGAVEFSADTLTLLDQVIKEHTMARSGKLGIGMQTVYGLDQFNQGISEIKKWRAVVAERVGIEDGRRAKGTVPVTRKQKAIHRNLAQHVPLVDGANDLAEQASAEPLADAVLEQASQVPLIHDVDPGAGFGFLSDANTPEVASQLDSSASEQVGKAEEEVPEKVEEKLQKDLEDDIKEEDGKSAEKSEAAAKSQTGDPFPWTLS